MGERVLHVRTDSIGDHVLASVLHEPIRKLLPGSHVTVVCQPHLMEMLAHCPWVDRIIPFERQPLLESAAYRENLIASLRREGFTLCLNSVYARDTYCDFIATNCGAPVCIAHEGEPPFHGSPQRVAADRAYTRLISSPGYWQTELQRHSDFLQAIGAPAGVLKPTIWSTPADAAAAEALFERENLDPDRTIVLFAGAASPVRHYHSYGTALAEICRENGFAIVVVGTEIDIAINAHNLKQLNVRTVDMIGKLTLLQCAEVVRRCRLAVGAETGTAQIAAAVETPHVVALGGGHFGRFTPNSPYTTGVSLPLECYGCRWWCRHSEPHCIRAIHPAVMTAAIRETLKRSAFERPRLFVQGRSLWKPVGDQPHWSWQVQFLSPTATFDVVTVEGTA